MQNIGSFKTSRLKVRPLTSGDLDDLVRLYQTPLVVRTLGGLRPRDQIIESLVGHLEHWDMYKFGYYIFEDKQTEAFVGRGGLRRCLIEGKNEVEIGYALLPEYWGKGLATEIVQKLVHLGFNKLHLISIVGFTLLDNEASKRVLEKNGFVFEKQIIYKDLPHLLYRITPDRLKEHLRS